MERTRALALSRTRTLSARHVTTWLALLGLLATPSCKDTNQPLAVESLAEGGPSMQATGAPATFTDGTSPNVGIRIYKDHDAWRLTSDGGRDEASLRSMEKVKGRDFSVQPMSSLASGIPAGTRVVIITANSLGDAVTSEAQRSAAAQDALVAFLGTGGTLVLDLADNESANGYMAPGAAGTPSLDVPPKPGCPDATFAPAAFGADGAPGTADDHRIVRGVDGLAGNADDLDDEKIDLANGGQAGIDRSGPSRGCAVAHGSLENGITLPSHAKVLATATWPDGQRPVLAEYCHVGGWVVVNTFTLGYFGHKPREGASDPIRSSYLQKSLFAYALSPENRDDAKPVLTVPENRTVNTDAGLPSARVDVGTASAADNCSDALVAISAARSDGARLDAPYAVGTTTITWTARDGAGNEVTDTQTITVKDGEAPAISVPADFAVNATMPGGAMVEYARSASDNVGVTSLSCSRESGTTFAIGAHEVSCTAMDAAGNSTSRGFTVTVLGAPEQIVNLIEYVKGATIPSPQRTQLLDLLAKVLADARHTDQACKGFDLLIAWVQSHSGSAFPADKAERIIADARRIKDVIGCPAS